MISTHLNIFDAVVMHLRAVVPVRVFPWLCARGAVARRVDWRGHCCSALYDQPLPNRSVMFGEIGLSGEIRAVARSEARLKEAEKLGFAMGYIPKNTAGKVMAMPIKSIETINDLARNLFGAAVKKKTVSA